MSLKYIEVSIENEKYSETETSCIPLSIALIDMVVYIHKIPVHLQPNPLAGARIINKIMDALYAL